jgi:hypothetical protein
MKQVDETKCREIQGDGKWIERGVRERMNEKYG